MNQNYVFGFLLAAIVFFVVLVCLRRKKANSSSIEQVNPTVPPAKQPIDEQNKQAK